jgi:hypothetical protein
MNLAHINFSSVERRTLGRDETERRRQVRAIVRVAGERLAVFNMVDEHLHLLGRSDWPTRRGESVRRVMRACRPDLEFTRPHVRPVRDLRHLQRSVPYVLNQTDHHEVGGSHPALWTGSAFLDVVGVRLMPGFRLTVLLQELPRLRQRDLLEAVGLEPVEIVPASDDALLRAGPARIAQLAAAVFAAGETYAGRSDETVKARTLAARVARDLEIATVNMAAFLGAVPRTVNRLAREPVDPRALLALRRRLTLEERVAEARRRGRPA